MTREDKFGWLAAFGVHFALIGGAMTLERDRPPVEPANIRVAETVEFDVELPKPEPIETPPLEAPKPAEVAKVERPVEPVAAPVARPKPRSTKPREADVETPSPSEPAPFVLSQVYQGGGSVVAEQGDEDVFGDPSVAANERNRRNPTDTPAAPRSVDVPPPPAPAVVRPEDVITRAVPRNSCPVDWPQDALVQRRIVEVKLLLTVDREGRVSEAKVLRGAGEPFDGAARAALERCAFEPGRRNGQTIIDRVPFVVEFKPRDA